MSANRPITRAMTTDATRQAVFSTHELVENIVSRLPQKDLFRYRRVSKHFKSAIEDSPTLQQTMFLRPRGTPRQTWHLRAALPGTHARRITSVRPSAGLPFLPRNVRSVGSHHPNQRKVLRTPAILNPALLSRVVDDPGSMRCLRVLASEELETVASEIAAV